MLVSGLSATLFLRASKHLLRFYPEVLTARDALLADLVPCKRSHDFANSSMPRFCMAMAIS